MAMLDCLADGPLSWEEINAQVAKALTDAGITLAKTNPAIMEGDLRDLWSRGLIRAVMKFD